ncbi:hypothetical protein [Legionella saoudiensis]|uniref:hypothetical protein n=1 Tax=Legionella saoudiensis TaxID=1750561 RepID=UPI000730C6F2|nr:hypothetical protein [Legionella saoudiensis]
MLKKTFQMLLMATVLSANGNALACPCFNAFYLNSLFSNNQGMACFLFTDYGRVVRASLSDGRYSAVSSIDGCSLNSASSNIHRNFVYYSNDNELCVEEILNACRMLNVEIQYY